jgi:hypothetical protein
MLTGMLKTTPQTLNAIRTVDAALVKAMRSELAARIDRLVDGEGAFATLIPRLFLGKVSQALHPVHTVYEPALCVIAQGTKRVLLGDEV